MSKLYTELSIFEFHERFVNDESCVDYLVTQKWGSGYQCRYCNHKRYCCTKRYGERRCTKCKKPESATAHTMFHKLKFPLLKAFYIVYYVSTNKKGISAAELSRKLDLRVKTCWSFKRKVMEAMASSNNHPIDGKVEVDEIFVGGHEEGSSSGHSTQRQAWYFKSVCYED